MTRPYVKKARPQLGRHTCLECDGRGSTAEWDWDGEEQARVHVRCEMCEGYGYLVDCNQCDEPMPPSYAEEGNGRCGPCRAGLEMTDRDAEIARLRRWTA